MPIESRIKTYGEVFPNWVIKDRIGSGSGGQSVVFRLQRKSEGWQTLQEEGALKVVNVIAEEGGYEQLSAQFKGDYEERSRTLCRQAEKEVELMYKLRGCANIVDYLDYSFKEWKEPDSYGYDLLIRMELLKNLRDEIRRGCIFDESEIIKVGKDICKALLVCHQNKILHRDIKPENIFFNERKDYKLGDFGISRIINGSRKANTRIATWEYAAPEQFAQTGNRDYDFSVDIYSLGLVLYELGNGNRLPFASSSYVQERELELRISGKALSNPCKVSSGFAKVILKACAYNPADRYHSAKDFLDALDALEVSTKNIYTKANENVQEEFEDNYKTQPAREENDVYRTEPAQDDYSNEREKTDIFTDVSITKAEAQKGCKKIVEVNLPENKKNILVKKRLEVSIPAGIHSGSKIRLQGKGKFRSDGSSGDLYIKVAVLQEKQRQNKDNVSGVGSSEKDSRTRNKTRGSEQRQALRMRNIFIIISIVLSCLIAYAARDIEGNFRYVNIYFGLMWGGMQILGIIGIVYGKKTWIVGICGILYGFSFFGCVLTIIIYAIPEPIKFPLMLLVTFVILPIMIIQLGKARRLYRVI